MKFAEGVEEVLRLEAGFADPKEAAAFWMAGGADVPSEDLTYTGGAGQAQRLRLYRGGGPDRPTLLYIHGGGWVGGSIELHDYSARGMAAGARCNVVSISYRLAPEHKYPAGLQDCLAATAWIENEGAAHGLHPARIVIGGASAGGNLAAAMALTSERGRFAGLLVFYGVLGADFETASYRRYENGPGLTRARMMELFDLYLNDPSEAKDHAVTPLHSKDLAKLPRTCIVAAEHDVLYDENAAFSNALQAADVSVDFRTEPGVTHGFINRGRLVPSADASIAYAARFLTTLAQPETTA